MQSRREGSRKKFKCIIQDVDGFTDTIDESTNNDAAIHVPIEVIEEPANNTTSAGSPIHPISHEKPHTNSPTTEPTVEMAAKDHSNTETAVHTFSEGAPTGEPSTADCIETTTGPPPPNEHITRSVLDEAGNSLEDVQGSCA